MGTGEVHVLATSRLVAWSEQTSLEAMRGQVPEGSTTVAMRVHLDHLKAASIGCQVTTIATLERIEGRRYIFLVTNLDTGNEVLAQGRIVRVTVETGPFLDSACQGGPVGPTGDASASDVGA
jgi:predicted thioesterase